MHIDLPTVDSARVSVIVSHDILALPTINSERLMFSGLPSVRPSVHALSVVRLLTSIPSDL